MLQRLVQFSLSQRLFILILVAILSGAGWYAYRGLPIDAFPDVSRDRKSVV